MATERNDRIFETTEERVQRFLEEECYTSPEEMDPRKPVILDGEFVKPNPNFNPALVQREWVEQEIERRKNNLGTSFFLNFDPLCNVHQLKGSLGDSIRQEIGIKLAERFGEVFIAQFPNNPPPLKSVLAALQVRLWYEERPGIDNGEIYFWLPGLHLKESFVFKMLKRLKKSLDKEPITVEVKEEKHELVFYGWGFRYY